MHFNRSRWFKGFEPPVCFSSLATSFTVHVFAGLDVVTQVTKFPDEGGGLAAGKFMATTMPLEIGEKSESVANFGTFNECRTICNTHGSFLPFNSFSFSNTTYRNLDMFIRDELYTSLTSDEIYIPYGFKKCLFSFKKT